MRIEHRYAELRSDGDRTVSGTVVRYGDVADIGGVFRERIDPGALAVREGLILNRQHQRFLPLVREGKGLILKDSPERMELRAEFPETSVADDALVMIRSGLLSGFSVEFNVREDSWTEGATLRTVHRATLVGVALVDRPAYPQSSVEAREKAILTATAKAAGRNVWYL